MCQRLNIIINLCWGSTLTWYGYYGLGMCAPFSFNNNLKTQYYPYNNIYFY